LIILSPIILSPIISVKILLLFMLPIPIILSLQVLSQSLPLSPSLSVGISALYIIRMHL
jgi:hypothetical protein